MELKEYIRVIRKRWWLIAALIVFGCAAVGVYSYVMAVPVYQASSKLIVNKSSNSVIDELSWNDVNTNIQLIATYKELIQTSAIMDKVVQQYPGLQETTESLIGKVSVSSVNETQVMTVAAMDVSYRHAAEIVNAVSKVFQSEVPIIMKVDNVTILDEAKPDANPGPVSPRPKLNIAVTFVLMVSIGIGIVFALEYFDDTVRTEEDIERILGMPTLAMIARIRRESAKSRGSTPTQTKVGKSYVSVNS